MDTAEPWIGTCHRRAASLQEPGRARGVRVRDPGRRRRAPVPAHRGGRARAPADGRAPGARPAARPPRACLSAGGGWTRVAAYAFAPLWASACLSVTLPQGWRCERSAIVVQRPAHPTAVKPPDCRPQRSVGADCGRAPAAHASRTLACARPGRRSSPPSWRAAAFGRNLWVD